MQPTFRHEDGPDSATRALIPCGELDGAAAGDVRHRIEQALAAGKRRVIVDLSQTTYMETSALAALLDANARVRHFGASLYVVIPSESKVRLIFSITRLDHVLTVTESRVAALAA